MNIAARPFATPVARRVLFAGLAWIVLYLMARFALDSGAAAHPWAILLVILPVPAFVVFAWALRVAIGQADELVRRMHLEALAFAFLATIVLLMVLGLLDSLPTARGDVELRNAWKFLPPLYGVGLALAFERYR